jgi:hypothetical protein
MSIVFNSLETVELRQIERVLRAKHGNLTTAAKALGIDRRTLYRKIEKYNLKRRNFKGQRREWAPHDPIAHDLVSAYPATIPRNTDA